ncbi:MAG: hypothetical protein L6V79_03665 [Clostridium sp.]|nr:MAG: hypothetical protein L6V79_03665 [Clostridium sp.]
MKEKFNGVLLHIGSLPSEYGVGALSGGRVFFCRFFGGREGRFLANAAVIANVFRRQPVSVAVGICGESVLY